MRGYRQLPSSFWKRNRSKWEIDWARSGSNGSKVWARNKSSHMKKARRWHLVTTGYLRGSGITTPTYRKDSWQVDWKKRKKKMVWARNPMSKSHTSRVWHWIDYKTIQYAGLKWKPVKVHTGRHNQEGYTVLSRCAMTSDDLEISKKYGLFVGNKDAYVLEHRLVAAKKYKMKLDGLVVRHLNGKPSDNRPCNLVIGTMKENTMDHNKARMMAMHWRRKYISLKKKYDALLSK